MGLFELYDVSGGTTLVTNSSTRGSVGLGDNVMIGGFILRGAASGNQKVVVRAIGPSLAQHGVANPLSDPAMLIYNANGAVIASNDDWRDTQAAEIQQSTLAPAAAQESAAVLTLPSGNYTAVVRGVGEATGVALVEIFVVR